MPSGAPVFVSEQCELRKTERPFERSEGGASPHMPCGHECQAAHQRSEAGAACFASDGYLLERNSPLLAHSGPDPVCANNGRPGSPKGRNVLLVH
jgi:hypothetical protein